MQRWYSYCYLCPVVTFIIFVLFFRIEIANYIMCPVVTLCLIIDKLHPVVWGDQPEIYINRWAGNCTQNSLMQLYIACESAIVSCVKVLCSYAPLSVNCVLWFINCCSSVRSTSVDLIHFMYPLSRCIRYVLLKESFLWWFDTPAQVVRYACFEWASWIVLFSQTRSKEEKRVQRVKSPQTKHTLNTQRNIAQWRAGLNHPKSMTCYGHLGLMSETVDHVYLAGCSQNFLIEKAR